MTYPSDLTDSGWLIVCHFDTGNYGKSRKHSQKHLMNGILYVIKTECQWHFLPKDFPPYKTVFSFYKRAKDKGIWEKIMEDLVKRAVLRWGAPQPKL